MTTLGDMRPSTTVSLLLTLQIGFHSLFLVRGGCILPDFPSENILCYVRPSETCNTTTITNGTELVSSDGFSVVCDDGFLPKETLHICVLIMPGLFHIIPPLGSDACQPACKDPGHPYLGSRSPDPTNNGYYKTGDVVDFSCGANTTQSGYTSLTCKADGEWYLGNDIVPGSELPPDTCFLNCMDPGTPVKGRKLSNNTNHRDSITFDCDEDLQLIGSETITCDNGTWSDVAPTCASVLISGVHVSMSLGQSMYAGEVNTVSFTTNVASSSLGAGLNGTNLWELDVFLTDGGSEPINTAPVKANISQDYADQTLIAGEALTFTANNMIDLAGYLCTSTSELCVTISSPQTTLHGLPADDFLTGCTRITCVCRNWTADFPNYIEVKPSSTAFPVEVGGVVELTCDNTGADNGRSLFGGDGPECQGNGLWSPPVTDFLCWENCPDPGDLMNGSITCQDPRRCFAPFYTITFACDDNFELVDGVDTYTCQYDGTWSPALDLTTGRPKCQGYCQAIIPPTNGQASSTEPALPGTTVTFTCRESYTMTGSSSATCQEAGLTWTHPPPVCYGNCFVGNTTNLIYKDGTEIKYEFIHGDIASVSCNVGTLVGPNNVQCFNGSWDASSVYPYCQVAGLSFAECPEGETLQYNVSANGDAAYIETLPVQAVDGTGQVISYEIEGIAFDIPGMLHFNEKSRIGIYVYAFAFAGNETAICHFVIRVVDNHPPRVTCPSDISRRIRDDRVTVDWEQPTVEDNVDVLFIAVSQPSGSYFYVGHNMVTVVASDSSGNTATCSFAVVVEHYQDQCNNLAGPENGMMACDNSSDGIQQCSLYCTNGFQPYNNLDAFACIAGVWTPPKVPRCVRRAPGPIR